MHPVPPALPHVCPSVSGNFRLGKVGADAQTKTMSEKAIIVRSKSISFIYINQIGGVIFPNLIFITGFRIYIKSN